MNGDHPVFDNLRLYLKLRPVIGALKKELRMKFSLNMLFQVIATLIQGANAVAGSGMLTPNQQGGLAVIVGAIQAVVAAIAHFHNPDGTKASEPYIKDSLKLT